MICPLGYLPPELDLARDEAGAWCVNGAPVTDAAGWIQIRLAESLVARGAPALVAVRIHAAPGAQGRWFIDAEEFVVNGRRYGTLFEVMAPDAITWMRPVADAVIASLSSPTAASSRAALAAAAAAAVSEPPTE